LTDGSISPDTAPEDMVQELLSLHQARADGRSINNRPAQVFLQN